jgi:hypothetical protein
MDLFTEIGLENTERLSDSLKHAPRYSHASLIMHQHT